jgi:hypothetical protein
VKANLTTIAAAACGPLAFPLDFRHIAAWESDGRGTRQFGQILTEAATTNSLRVIRLLFSQILLVGWSAVLCFALSICVLITIKQEGRELYVPAEYKYFIKA